MTCMACEGRGYIRREVPCRLYDCKTAIVTEKCPRCLGAKTAPEIKPNAYSPASS